VERALALSKADGCIVIATETSDANIRWANNTLTTNGVSRSRALTVIATVNNGTGTAAGVVSRSGVTDESLEPLVRAAEDAARTSRVAEDAQPLVAAEQPASTWDAAPPETSISVFSSFVPSLGDAFQAAASQDRLLFGYAFHEMRSTYLASSAGLRLHHDQPTGYTEINGKSTDYARSAWVGKASADFTDVDVAGLDAELAERLGWAARRIELPPARYETLLPPTAVADLMIDLYWSAGGRDAHDGRTVFSKPGGGTRVGEQLTASPVTLRSDPGAGGLECAPFVIAYASGGTDSAFDNGLPLHPTRWISDGVLTSLVQTRHSAALTGLPVTPAIDNLIMEGPAGGRSAGEMVAGTERGLLLTCLWYIREVDPQTLLLTGLTRDGVYLVEKGEVVGAVNNFRFNESPVALLGRVTEVGATERTLPREWSDYFTRAAMPMLRVPDFNMSSASQAS
jgi:predicted Zn-dependent protease